MPFFKLPQELRDTVYDELFQGVSLTSLNSRIRPDLDVTFHFFYKFNGDRKHRNLPCWLFTCKQVFHEALEQWYCGASCSPCFCTHNMGRTTAGTYAAAFCELDRAQSFDAYVLSNKYGDDGEYVLWPKRQTRKTTSQVLVPRMSEDHRSYSVMDCFFRYLTSNSGHPAKTITFSLALAPSEFLSRGVESVDLSWFQSLHQRFDCVVFRIKCPFTSDRILGAQPWPQLRHTATMYTKIQHEAIRVGKCLVSDVDSTGWDVHDSLVPMEYSDDVTLDAFEWQVEILLRPTQQNECIQYEGLRYCCVQEGRNRFNLNYFRPLYTDAQGHVTFWICDETNRVMSLV